MIGWPDPAAPSAYVQAAALRAAFPRLHRQRDHPVGRETTLRGSQPGRRQSVRPDLRGRPGDLARTAPGGILTARRPSQTLSGLSSPNWLCRRCSTQQRCYRPHILIGHAGHQRVNCLTLTWWPPGGQAAFIRLIYPRRAGR